MRISTALLAALVAVGTPVQAAPPAKPRLPFPPKMLWLDNEADPHALASRSKVATVLDRAADAGFNIVVPDTRNWHGHLFYGGSLGVRPRTIAGRPYPAGFDLLRTVAAEAASRGLRVYAGVNVFVGGAKDGQDTATEGWQHPAWQSVLWDSVTEVRVGGAPPVLARGVNDRASTGVSVLNRRFGSRLFRRDSPGNAADGVRQKAAGRWVSESTSGTHWLELAWPEPVRVAEVALHFPRGNPAPTAVLIADGHPFGSVERNRALLALIRPADGPRRVSRLRIEFPAGGDGVSRVDEVEVLSPGAGNVARTAAVTADSSMRRGGGVLAAVSGGRVVAVEREESLPPAGMEVPSDGCLVVLEDADPLRVAAMTTGTAVEVVSGPRLLRESEHPGGALLYLNPADPEVQDHLLAILDEIMQVDGVEGVVLDRVRYDNARADFSDTSRRLFEKAMNLKVADWPRGVMTPPDPFTGSALKMGPHFEKWVLWRAQVIRAFVARCRALADRRGRLLGDYVGGWYGTYWEVGVNWASDTYNPERDYEWAPQGYRRTGYAQMLDFLSPGLYFPALRRGDGPNRDETVEGGIALARRITGPTLPLAAGLYVPNLNTPEAFEQAVRLCLEEGGGVMVFSHTTLDKMARWDAARLGLQAVPRQLE